MKFNIFGWCAVAVLLMTASCQRDPLNEQSFGRGDYETVRFTLSPETSIGQTRTVHYPGEGEFPHISDGTKADVLIYAVYDSEGNLLPEYGKGVVGTDLPEYITAGEGQTVISAKTFPVEIVLEMKRKATYTVAFWAQSSKCKAYDTQDLKRVRIIYEELEGEGTSTPNNDELRDAFCKNEKLTLSSKAEENREVILYRPLAQINVGTTGYDFESVVQDQKQQYAYTRVQIITAARYLNVVENTIESGEDSDLYSALDYTYARIPAYNNYTDEEFSRVDLMTIDETGKEEFLRVHLYDEAAEGDEYMPVDEQTGFRKYATLTDEGKKTETFKYLSMCYVLVASPEEGTNGTIANVNVWIATDPDSPEASEVQIVDLVNVPAQRNWRTNIIGNILTENVPFSVVLDPIYSGDYNGWYDYDNGGVEWSGPLADGAYYDAENDEILISNVNGLIWFQQMVNGKLIYRQTHSSHTSKKGSVYEDDYFPAAGGTKKFADTFGNLYVSMPEDAKLAARILKATHQSINPYRPSTNNGWPTNNNFHFMGKEGSTVKPAKVKLVADIDLSGVEWLPIGFDGAVYDGSMREHIDISNNSVFQNGKTVNDATDRRAFCGEFDGNGHTISNIRDVKFSAEVLPVACQDKGDGYYDNPQWFGTGLFGLVGGNAYIHDLRVSNVEVSGFHTGGGIVGTANGDNVRIENCTVDGGKVVLTPMHRGDSYNPARTFARGIYAGGIVGYYNGTGRVYNCTIQNLEVSAYRNIGGVVGTDGYSISGNNYKKSSCATISDNTVNNVIIIANKFQPYDQFFHSNTYGGGIYKNAYGWNQNQLALSGDILGGEATSGLSNNKIYDVIRTEFSTRIDNANSTERIAEIENVPLNYMPMLSSFFCDKLTLKANFSGKPSAYKRYNLYEFNLDKDDKNKVVAAVTNAKIFPFDLPEDTSVKFVETSGKVGMYVESVELDGKQSAERTNSAVTVENVTGHDDCAMFITSRNLYPFSGYVTSQATTVKNMIVRGLPYAFTGICLSPNQYTASITLNNVSVYDVYQTLALQESISDDNVWPNTVDASTVTLKVVDSNLRGYTVPGAGWKSITYDNVIFERGAVVSGDGADVSKISTCKVEASTTFNNCTFKAPFTIEIAEGQTPTFTECYATSGKSSEPIELPAGCTKVEIDNSGQITYTPEN